VIENECKKKGGLLDCASSTLVRWCEAEQQRSSKLIGGYKKGSTKRVHVVNLSRLLVRWYAGRQVELSRWQVACCLSDCCGSGWYTELMSEIEKGVCALRLGLEPEVEDK